MMAAIILNGFALGYLIATLVESYAHQYVSDAPRKYVKQWMRYPRLCKYMIRTHYSHHTVHHCRTYRQDFVTQFRNDQEREYLDRELENRGIHGQIIKASHYGVRLHGSGALVFIVPLLPGIPLILNWLGPLGLSGALMALALPPLLSHFVHPYLHMPHSKAVYLAPLPISMLLKTRFFRAMARSHFMHHRYVMGNFNLLLGGDILRGVARKPSEKDLDEMKRIGLRID